MASEMSLTASLSSSAWMKVARRVLLLLDDLLLGYLLMLDGTGELGTVGEVRDSDVDVDNVGLLHAANEAVANKSGDLRDVVSNRGTIRHRFGPTLCEVDWDKEFSHANVVFINPELALHFFTFQFLFLFLFLFRAGISVSRVSNTMFSCRLPVPLPTPSFHSNRYSYCFSQTHSLTAGRRATAIAPRSVAVGDDGASAVGEVAEALPEELEAEAMPKHVAVIMDGNGRWAKLRGLAASAGHQAGVQSLRRMVRLCCSWGIKVLTVFAFSTDNWVRPKVEVDFLMRLFESTINSEVEAFKREGIRISVIGDSSKLPESLKRLIANAEENTKHNSRLQLIVAVSYSGKYDIVQACKSVAKKVQDGLLHLDDIDENIIERELETNCTEFPYPDLLIRTSGELRVSNFLLWQLAYAELYFNRELWPDFGKDEFVDALISFQQRQRRYGGRHS
ncbi:hypothetical protein Fmac_031379 [Flemingia macrophylla]|uniref:Alkyl transferase n=1 Tax=Flemingia macrophylla TaxID=520843 RepID=A0ABD1L1W4_9FABA